MSAPAAVPLPAATADPVSRLERLVAARPGDVRLRVDLGFALLDARRWVAARAVLLSAARQEPRLFVARLGAAKAARGLGDIAAATAHGRAAARLDPREIGVRLDLGFDFLGLARWEEAEAAFLDVLAIDARHAGALVGLGHLARRRGDRPAAMARFQAALDAEPGHTEATLELAAEHAEAGREQAALPLVDAVLRSRPEDLRALMQRGHLARASGDHATAAKFFRRAVKAHPGVHEAAVALAEAHRDMGDPATAARMLRRVLAADPENLHALLCLADQSWLAENYDLCLALSMRAARAHPGHVAPPLQATRALMEQGRAAEALALLEPFGEENGWPQPLVARKAEILQANGDWDAAAAVLASVTEPPEFVLWLRRMRQCLVLGDFTTLEQGLAANPARGPAERGFVGLLRGQVAEARWQLVQARDAWLAALDGNPNAAVIHGELARLGLLLADLDLCRVHNTASLQGHAAVHKLRGQSTNPSSTHVGQIWDEFRMDRPRAARLRELVGHPPEIRVPELLEMVREWPDHLPTAMLLGVALRQSGMLEFVPIPDPACAIPRRIVQFWDSAEPPAEIAGFMAGWREAHPDWEHARFTLQTAGEYLRDNHPIEVVRAYVRAGLAAQKADIFRLAWLAREGGVYVDADDRCIGHLSSVLQDGTGLLAWQEHFGTLGNNFLAAAPGHPVLARALALAVEALNRGDQDIPWLSTGPGLLTRAFAQVLAESPGPADGLRGCVVLERFQTARLALFHQFSAYKTTSKHWLRASFRATEQPASGGEEAGMEQARVQDGG